MAYFGKTYTLYKQENFDGFLRSVGLPEDKIAALLSSDKSEQTLEKDGDSYIFTQTIPGGTNKETFQSGVEFDSVIGPAKTAVKNKIVVDGNTVTQTISSVEKGTAVFTKVYDGDELVVTITKDGWDGSAKRYYRA